jgi:hypothetical protein
MGACKHAKFPICLDRSMYRMFGEKGKRSIDAVVMDETIANMEVSSPKDVWNIYDRYMEQVASLYGERIAQVFEYEGMREMESMMCVKCPLYQSVSKKRN